MKNLGKIKILTFDVSLPNAVFLLLHFPCRVFKTFCIAYIDKKTPANDTKFKRAIATATAND